MTIRDERFATLMAKRGMTTERANWILDTVDNAKPIAPRPELRLSAEQEAIALSLVARCHNGLIVRASEYPIFRSMFPTETYHGNGVCAVRRQVDELDNVTICPM